MGRHADTAATMVAIVSALPEEIQPWVKVVQNRRTVRLSRFRFIVAKLGSYDVVLAHTGIGPRRAKDGTRRLLHHVDVARILFVGLSGALTPSLSRGDVLAAGEVRDIHQRVAPSPDFAWLTSALCIPGIQRGNFITTPHPVISKRDKASLLQQMPTGIAAAVDMETAVFAETASEFKIPYVAVRSILDTARDDLPSILSKGQRNGEPLNRIRIVKNALCRPSSIPKLLNLRHAVRIEAERLVAIASALVTI